MLYVLNRVVNVHTNIIYISFFIRYTGAKAELNSSPTVSLDTVYVGSNDFYLHGKYRKSKRERTKEKEE